MVLTRRMWTQREIVAALTLIGVMLFTIVTAGIRETAAYMISQPTRSDICIFHRLEVLTLKAVPGAN